ncbi:putative potassium channel regulatory protein [Glandiceps talaboti]
MSPTMKDENGNDVIKCVIGDRVFSMPTTVLTKYPNSRLATMIENGTKRDKIIRVFTSITPAICLPKRNGQIFPVILQFLRTGRISLPRKFVDFESLETEIRFYGIPDLCEALQEYKLRFEKKALEMTTYVTPNVPKIEMFEYVYLGECNYS